MEQTKSPFGSLTVLAGVAVFALGIVGITIDVQEATTALEYVDDIIAAVAGLAAIYGRIRADKRIAL